MQLDRFLAVFGPGLVVMLADSDVGSLVTAGQSGAQWGYRLLPLQVLLIPLLYMMQELAVRLGIFTGRGHGELIREMFGACWAWLSALALAVATGGALLAEFSGVAGVGDLFGVPRAVTLPGAVLALLAVVATGSYRRVERVALVVGLFELSFLGVAFAARPDFSAVASDVASVPWRDPDFRLLVAANIGSVVMPWMIFYQQSAIADRRLRPEHFAAARWDTAAGAVVTQTVMAAVLIAAAATIGRARPDARLASVGDLSAALAPLLGWQAGRVVFALGVLGAALVAAIVASLGLAWGVGEVAGLRRSLERRPGRVPWFQAVFAASAIGIAMAVWAAPDLVALNLGVQTTNALLLPLVLGLLIQLSRRALPRTQRLRGWYLGLVVAVAGTTCALGVWAGLAGALG
jgi:NRAMP (natural resistance-associated macrophage protein)-like metal ion transporter